MCLIRPSIMISLIRRMVRNFGVSPTLASLWKQFSNSSSNSSAKHWLFIASTFSTTLLRGFLKMQENEVCCAQCCHSLAKEFQKEKFLLRHQPVDDFCKSQWQQQSRAWWWLIYRWCLALCFALGVFGSMVLHFSQGKYFIYLTHWGFILCLLTSVYGALLATFYYCNPKRYDTSNWIFQLYWASHWSTLVLAILISLVYWSFLYPLEDSNAAGDFNLLAHAFNSILMLIDFMLVAFPSRLMHFIYPFTVGIIYFLFSLIYYFAGGLDAYGNHYIYPILDWSKPGQTVGTFFGCVVVVSLFCFLLFWLYKLRNAIYRRRNKTVMTLNA